jgi:hypothetical protein
LDVGAFAHDAVEGGAEEADGLFEAFGVAAEPEEVVGGAAGDAAGGARGADDGGCGGGRGRGVEGVGRDDPRVFADAAGAHGDDPAIRFGTDAREAAGEEVVLVAADGEAEGAPDEGAGLDFALREGGGGGEGEAFLGDPVLGGGAEAVEHLGEFGAAEVVEEDGVAGAAGEGGFEDPAGGGVEDALEFALLAAPPGGDGADEEVFAEEFAADAGEEGVEGGGFDEAGAEAVDEGDAAGAPSFGEAGDAEFAVAAHFEGVGVDVVDVTEDDVDAFEAFEGFEPEAAVADGEVGAFDEGEAEVAGFEGVLEVGFVAGARGEHEDAGVTATCEGGEAAEGFPHEVEVVGDAADVRGVEFFLEDLAEDGAVFEGVAVGGGALGAVGEDDPSAGGVADEVAAVDVEEATAGGIDAADGAEEAGVGVDELGWEEVFLDEALGAVDVLEDGFEEADALGEGGGDGLEVGVGDEEGEDVEHPGAAGAEGVVEDVVSDAVVVEEALDGIGAAGEVRGGALLEETGEGAPVGTDGAVREHHFVEDARGGEIGSFDREGGAGALARGWGLRLGLRHESWEGARDERSGGPES